MTIADQMGLNKSNLLQVILQELLDAYRDVELITIAMYIMDLFSIFREAEQAYLFCLDKQ